MSVIVTPPPKGKGSRVTSHAHTDDNISSDIASDDDDDDDDDDDTNEIIAD